MIVPNQVNHIQEVSHDVQLFRASELCQSLQNDRTATHCVLSKTRSVDNNRAYAWVWDQAQKIPGKFHQQLLSIYRNHTRYHKRMNSKKRCSSWKHGWLSSIDLIQHEASLREWTDCCHFSSFFDTYSFIQHSYLISKRTCSLTTHRLSRMIRDHTRLKPQIWHAIRRIKMLVQLSLLCIFTHNVACSNEGMILHWMPVWLGGDDKTGHSWRVWPRYCLTLHDKSLRSVQLYLTPTVQRLSVVHHTGSFFVTLEIFPRNDQIAQVNVSQHLSSSHQLQQLYMRTGERHLSKAVFVYQCTSDSPQNLVTTWSSLSSARKAQSYTEKSSVAIVALRNSLLL